MTLGHVYDLDLRRNEAPIKEVIIQAQGEVSYGLLRRIVSGSHRIYQMALEEYIRQVKETWSSYHLELVNYQNKIRLIRYVPLLYRFSWSYSQRSV